MPEDTATVFGIAPPFYQNSILEPLHDELGYFLSGSHTCRPYFCFVTPTAVRRKVKEEFNILYYHKENKIILAICN